MLQKIHFFTIKRMRAGILIAAISAISYGEDQFIEGQPGPGMVVVFMITPLRAK